MTEIDPEEMLSKLNSGKGLSSMEIEQVVSMLELVKIAKPVSKETIEIRGVSAKQDESRIRQPGVDEIFSLIKIIGKAELKDRREVVESFLLHDDPLTVSLVLEILCLKWKETDRYLEQVVNFALGVSWDDEGDVADTAIGILGEYLHDNMADLSGEKELHFDHVKSLLVDILKNDTLDQWLRQKSYFSILRAMGKDWSEIPSECSLIDFSRESGEIDWRLVSEFKKIS